MTQKYRINDKIRVPEVRLIDDEGKNLGVVAIADALRLAEESELDLVEVSPEAEPPVCRILDYGKLKYQQKKKTQQKRKPKIQQKEIRIRPRISEHDMEIKLKQAREFLEHGDKVLFTLSFRGREMAHLDPGRELMEKIGLDLEEVAKVDKTPKLEGKKMCMMVVPKGLN